MEGRTAVRPSGITPDFHAAFKQTWYKCPIDWVIGDERCLMFREISHG